MDPEAKIKARGTKEQQGSDDRDERAETDFGWSTKCRGKRKRQREIQEDFLKGLKKEKFYVTCNDMTYLMLLLSKYFLLENR